MMTELRVLLSLIVLTLLVCKHVFISSELQLIVQCGLSAITAVVITDIILAKVSSHGGE